MRQALSGTVRTGMTLLPSRESRAPSRVALMTVGTEGFLSAFRVGSARGVRGCGGLIGQQTGPRRRLVLGFRVLWGLNCPCRLNVRARLYLIEFFFSGMNAYDP